jgi:hypothetical protein
MALVSPHRKDTISTWEGAAAAARSQPTRCVPTQTELDSYLHSTSYNNPDVEIENTFGYMMRRRSEDRFLLSSNCKPTIKAKVSYIMEPLPLKGFFTMDTVPRQNVLIVVRKTFTHFVCLLKNLH